MKYAGWLALVTVCSVPLSWALQAPKVYSLVPQSAVTTPGAQVGVLGSGFAPETGVYFGGVQARSTNFVSPSYLEVVTPYLRPGEHAIELKSGGISASFPVSLQALASDVDAQIDHALLMANQDQDTNALDELEKVAETSDDYQVKAFAHYQKGQIYFAMGDFWRWGGETYEIFFKSDLAGMAVQTYWPYRLAAAQVNYFFQRTQDRDFDLKSADYFDKFDVTRNPEPLFYRSVLNARAGRLTKAKADSDGLLKVAANDPSYLALAGFIAALRGDNATAGRLSLKARSLLKTKPGIDTRTLSLLGETAYALGNLPEARRDWAIVGHAKPADADLAYLAGKKHLWRGERRTARMLLIESISIAPDGKDASQARELLQTIPESTQ